MDGIGVKRLVPSSLFILGMLLVITGFGCTVIPSPSPAQAIPTPTPTPLPRIAFTAISEDNTQQEGTFTVNMDGTQLKLLTKIGDQAAWAPDGEHLALRYFAGDRQEIWIFDREGGNPRPAIAQGAPPDQENPVWSWDGKRIAFVGAAQPDYTQAIYVMNLDSGALIQIPCLAFSFCTNPSWSPDNQQLVFASKQVPNPGHPTDIYVTEVASNAKPRVLQENADSPVWQPHGNLIAFGQEHDGKKDLLVMDSNGANVRTLVKDGAWQLAWSPDGMHIAFAGILQTGRGADICIINADGSGLHCLENPATGDTAPVWSPDGQQIAFVGMREGHQEIYVMNVDGSNLRRLIDSPFQQIAPAWSPR